MKKQEGDKVSNKKTWDAEPLKKILNASPEELEAKIKEIKEKIAKHENKNTLFILELMVELCEKRLKEITQ